MAFSYRAYAKANPYGNLGPSPATAARITPSKPTISTIGKPKGLTAEQWARQQAQKYIDAQIASINQQRDAYLTDLRSNSDLEMQRGAELAKALQALNLPGQIQGVYQNAAADSAGLAKGFSGTLQTTAAADAAQQSRMVSGTGQEGAVRNQGENMGNVLYGAQGYIPAKSLGEAGAAFGAQAALEPSFAARIGQMNAADVYSEGLKGLDQFTKAKADAESGRFDMEQELLTGRQKQIGAVTAAAYKQAKDERDYYVKQAYLALARGDRKRSNDYLTLAHEKEARMTNAGMGLDVNGNPLPGYKKNADGTIVKVDKNAAAKAKKAQTNSRKAREDEFRSARLDAIDEAKKLIVPATTLRPEQRPSYQVAYAKLFNRYKDLLRFASAGGQKKLRARLDQLIREALTQNGFTQPPTAAQSGSTARRAGSTGSSFAGDR